VSPEIVTCDHLCALDLHRSHGLTNPSYASAGFERRGWLLARAGALVEFEDQMGLLGQNGSLVSILRTPEAEGRDSPLDS
jgi:hypothetical protein